MESSFASINNDIDIYEKYSQIQPIIENLYDPEEKKKNKKNKGKISITSNIFNKLPVVESDTINSFNKLPVVESETINNFEIDFSRLSDDDYYYSIPADVINSYRSKSMKLLEDLTKGKEDKTIITKITDEMRSYKEGNVNAEDFVSNIVDLIGEDIGILLIKNSSVDLSPQMEEQHGRKLRQPIIDALESYELNKLGNINEENEITKEVVQESATEKNNEVVQESVKVEEESKGSGFSIKNIIIILLLIWVLTKIVK